MNWWKQRRNGQPTKSKSKKGSFFNSANVTWVCLKHGKTSRSRFGASCPVCREPMKSMGYRWRVGRNGQLTKQENFTKSKLDRRASRI